jgi:uncharacterized protein (UPF0332 family)
MSLSNEERTTLVALELKKARETYEDINILIGANRLNGAANRMYYAVFHAVCALLIHDGHQVNTHKGSHALFSLHYIKTGILPKEYGLLYNQLQTMREESDYNCAYDVEIDELKQRLEPARRLIEDIEKLVNKQKKLGSVLDNPLFSGNTFKAPVGAILNIESGEIY